MRRVNASLRALFYVGCCRFECEGQLIVIGSCPGMRLLLQVNEEHATGPCKGRSGLRAGLRVCSKRAGCHGIGWCRGRCRRDGRRIRTAGAAHGGQGGLRLGLFVEVAADGFQGIAQVAVKNRHGVFDGFVVGGVDQAVVVVLGQLAQSHRGQVETQEAFFLA